MCISLHDEDCENYGFRIAWVILHVVLPLGVWGFFHMPEDSILILLVYTVYSVVWIGTFLYWEKSTEFWWQLLSDMAHMVLPVVIWFIFHEQREELWKHLFGNGEDWLLMMEMEIYLKRMQVNSPKDFLKREIFIQIVMAIASLLYWFSKDAHGDDEDHAMVDDIIAGGFLGQYTSFSLGLIIVCLRYSLSDFTESKIGKKTTLFMTLIYILSICFWIRRIEFLLGNYSSPVISKNTYDIAMSVQNDANMYSWGMSSPISLLHSFISAVAKKVLPNLYGGEWPEFCCLLLAVLFLFFLLHCVICALLIAICHGRNIPVWRASLFFAAVSYTCPFVSIKFLHFMHIFEDDTHAFSWFEGQEKVVWVCKPYSRVYGVFVTAWNVGRVTFEKALPKIGHDLELLSSLPWKILQKIWRMATKKDQNTNQEPKRGRGRPRKVQQNSAQGSNSGQRSSPRARSRSRG